MSDIKNLTKRFFSSTLLKVLLITFVCFEQSFANGERNEKILISVNSLSFSKQNTKTSAGEVIGKIADALLTGQISVQQKGYEDAVRASIVKGISQSHRIMTVDGALKPEEVSAGNAYYVDATIPNIATATKTSISSDGKYTTTYYKATISAILHVKDAKTDAVVYSPSFNISDLDLSWFTSSEEALAKCLGVLSRKITKYFNTTVPLSANIIEGAKDKKDKQKEVYIDLGEEEGAMEGLHFTVYQVKTIAGKEARKQIGKLKIKEVLGNDISLCKVQSGGREIKEALEAGESIVVLSTD